MKTIHRELSLSTASPIQIVDMTAEVLAVVRSSGINDGLLTLSSRHTTAYVNINEREEKLQTDMVEFLERLAPPAARYRHNENPVDDRPNAHAHLLGLLMSPSQTIPVQAGALTLGEWQSIFFVELDGPRERRVLDLFMMGA